MSLHKILFTGNADLAAPLLACKPEPAEKLLHMPLEHYSAYTEPEESSAVKSGMQHFAYVVYGNLRNARYFIDWVKSQNLLQEIQNRVNLAADKPAAGFLEEQGIPVILPKEQARPIDVLEFMLRISREGNTLYPTSDKKAEEIPGLLKELDLPVAEFTVCREVPVEEGKLIGYREQIKKTPPEGVLFHNRSSLTRIKTAFPELDISLLQCIAADRGVAEKMKQEGLSADKIAHGTWASLAKILCE